MSNKKQAKKQNRASHLSARITYDSMIDLALATGRIKVKDNGDIIRINKDGSEREDGAPQQTIKDRAKQEPKLVVNYQPNSDEDRNYPLPAERVVYTALIGNLDPREIVCFSDGNSLNLDPRNLYVRRMSNWPNIESPSFDDYAKWHGSGGMTRTKKDFIQLEFRFGASVATIAEKYKVKTAEVKKLTKRLRPMPKKSGPYGAYKTSKKQPMSELKVLNGGKHMAAPSTLKQLTFEKILSEALVVAREYEPGARTFSVSAESLRNYFRHIDSKGLGSPEDPKSYPEELSQYIEQAVYRIKNKKDETYSKVIGALKEAQDAGIDVQQVLDQMQHFDNTDNDNDK